MNNVLFADDNPRVCAEACQSVKSENVKVPAQLPIAFQESRVPMRWDIHRRLVMKAQVYYGYLL